MLELTAHYAAWRLAASGGAVVDARCPAGPVDLSGVRRARRLRRGGFVVTQCSSGCGTRHGRPPATRTVGRRRARRSRTRNRDAWFVGYRRELGGGVVGLARDGRRFQPARIRAADLDDFLRAADPRQRSASLSDTWSGASSTRTPGLATTASRRRDAGSASPSDGAVSRPRPLWTVVERRGRDGKANQQGRAPAGVIKRLSVTAARARR